MTERLLRSWIRVPLIVQRDFPLIVKLRTSVSRAACADAAAKPGSMLAQQVRGDVFVARVRIASVLPFAEGAQS